LIVADASAVVAILTATPGDERAERIFERMSSANGVHVPHLIDSEVQAAIRGMVLGFKLPLGRAAVALDDFEDLALLRYPAQPLSRATWNLRDVVTTYDATYVALAEALGCPLVTCDRRLARAVPAVTEVY